MNLIKPKNLKNGDTLEIIAPAGEVQYEEIAQAKDYFENLGYKIIFGEHLFEKDRYLAGNDKNRIEDLHNAFLNKDVDAILCARGGYGTIRLINNIDYNIIRNNPKIFCGYSDITALSLMFLKECNLITFSGPMAQPDFGIVQPNSITSESFFKTLSGNYFGYNSKKIISTGGANGIVWGGNLSTITSLCGQDFIPDEQFICFLEDINEPVYKIDKMIRQLLNIPKFRKNISSILFGEFLNNDSESWLEELEIETAQTLNVPAAAGFMFSHSNVKQTIPIGIYANYSDGCLNIK